MNPNLLIAGAKYVATYAAALTGASLAIDMATKSVLAKTPVAPILAGPIVDAAFNLADPFDWTGHQKRKGKAPLVGLGTPGGKIDRLTQKVEAEASAAIEKAKTLPKDAAEHARRWVATARSMGKLAKCQENEAEALKLAAAAIDLAKMGQNPPTTALDVLGNESTDEGRALITTAVDTVNRFPEDPSSFNPDNLAARLANPAAYLEAAASRDNAPDFSDGAGMPMAGPGCCSSCSYGTGSCDAKGKGPVPEEYLNGLAHGSSEMVDDDFYITGDNDEPSVGELVETAISGPQDVTMLGEEEIAIAGPEDDSATLDQECFGMYCGGACDE